MVTIHREATGRGILVVTLRPRALHNASPVRRGHLGTSKSGNGKLHQWMENQDVTFQPQ
jgi:hypothetical protein